MKKEIFNKEAIVNKRKIRHLQICMNKSVEYTQKTTWFEHVELVHQAIPEVELSDIDTSTEFLGHRLNAPFIIGAMTGGTPLATNINHTLATIAQQYGIGLALGSQRPMIDKNADIRSYMVREIAPDILLLGNIGINQAANMSTEDVVELMHRINADAMCLHLNTAMQVFQTEMDEPIVNVKSTIERLSSSLGEKLIVKEVGCGISKEIGSLLYELGVHTIDVAGAGGTSWVRVEGLRNRNKIGEMQFENWGIPTAASLLELKSMPFNMIASGGIRSGLDLAKALVLGANIGSAALPILKAINIGGKEMAEKWINSVVADLKISMLLTGSYNIKSLRGSRSILLGPLQKWALQL